MSESLTIERAGEADTPEILAVLKAALGETAVQRRTPELFRWKHEENPFGKSIVLLAKLNGQIAGVRALLRWELRTDHGESIRCARPVDTATHPDHLRKGVFRTLTVAAVDIARQEGIQLLFNTPNEKSFPGYLSMGWSEVGWIGAMARPRIGKALRSEPGNTPRLSDALPTAVPFETKSFADRAPLGLRTHRTEAYQHWRYERHPYARYGWVEDPDGRGGLVVRPSVRSGRSETLISDIIGEVDDNLLRRTIRESRSRYVAGWFSEHSPERIQARRAGLVTVPRMRTLRLVANPLTEFDPNPTSLASWDLSLGDLELL